MLKRIRLENFRRHATFRVSCKERNIFVGPNNAGKSSILDALRLFADVARFAQRRLPVLRGHYLYGICATYEMANSNFSIPVLRVPTNDTLEDAKVEITHQNGSTLHVRLNPEHIPTVFITTDKRARTTKGFFRQCFPEQVVVVPTLSQFEAEEKINGEEYVRSVEHTRLAARNFRNIWHLKGEAEFEVFSDLVESNWENVLIRKPRLVGIPAMIEMEYIEDGVAREVYLSGFGFQAWLQIMTQFLRSDGDTILVLDEPDVYLHADLQRRLFHIARKRFKQLFVATHSAELMNEAYSGDVVLVRAGVQSGKRVTTEKGYRDVHDLLGSSESADFARLARAKRIIAFEGNDRTLYRRFEQRLGLEGVFSDPDTVMLKIGGFGQWQKVATLPWAFTELFGFTPKIAAIFDRDYRCMAEVTDHEETLNDAGILCHVLRRKEIENYALEESVIKRAILKLSVARGASVTEEQIEKIIANAADQLKEDSQTNSEAATIKYYSRKKDRRDTKEILGEAKKEFLLDWKQFGFKKRVSGKEFVRSLIGTLQNEFKLNLTLIQIIDNFRADEVDEEFGFIIREINTYFK